MRKINILIVATTILTIIGCTDWTKPEPLQFDNQAHLMKLTTLIEAKSEEDLNPEFRELYKKIREEYRNQPRVKGFGWFGNWTGRGSNPQNYMRALPDSVDFISVWGTRGKLSKEQQADLKFFQEVKGGKALLCWIVQSLGDQLTPHGKDPQTFWRHEKGDGTRKGAIIAYANAIADTIEKYNFDGFDIDYEPTHGHPGNMADWKMIQGDHPMQIFIEALSARLRPAGRMLVMDGEPDKLSTETSKLIDHYIYQAYWEDSTNGVINKINNPHLVDWERKTIITCEFEQGWEWGGINPKNKNVKAQGRYFSVRDELIGVDGAQILDHATLDLPSGKRIGGIGTYHMEYDYPNNPHYKWLRKALYYGNQKYKGNYQ